MSPPSQNNTSENDQPFNKDVLVYQMMVIPEAGRKH